MESVSVTPWYLDKGLWVAVLGPVLIVLGRKLGWTLDPQEVVGLILPIVAFVVMHKWKSGKIVIEEIAAKAAADAAAKPGASPAASLTEAGKP